MLMKTVAVHKHLLY